MTEIAKAPSYPAGFPADLQEVSFDTGASVRTACDALTVRYGRTVSHRTLEIWTKEAGLKLRTKADVRNARRAGRIKGPLTSITYRGTAPTTFRDDFQEIYFVRGLALAGTARELSKRYGREISLSTLRSWVESAGITLRPQSVAKVARGGGVAGVSLSRVTEKDVERAEAAGEIVRAPVQVEEPLVVPFEEASADEAPIDGIPVPAEGYTFAELRPEQCRWCISPNATKAHDFRFCGALRSQPGKPYCVEHQARAYRVGQEVSQ